jgi:hypothetical protein
MFKHRRCLVDRFQDVVSNHANFISIPIERAVELGLKGLGLLAREDQFATIHPYFDGNGRTARLLTTLILHLGSYDLKGLYSLEEYYARHLDAYYQAISIGPSHNYYMGRAAADITPWVEYFVEGMAVAFENVYQRMNEAQQL